MNVLVETSARHAHVTQEDLEKLFGPGAALTVKKDLSQPGQYASDQKVRVIGPRGEFNMSILGPTRTATQVEISLTDARSIGIAAPIRESGDIDGAPGCKIAGPYGEIEIACGVIAAKRHIHMTPESAEQAGVADQQVVSVNVKSQTRSLLFGDVVVRVNKNFSPAMHLDTDEANAAGLSGEVYGEIVV
ncbi:MAG: phosphate propanoyltransferase [Oscillospiraceae bacterium]|jgi:putative phosphotransacetylase|nr:phosphate propanoyltransferase [Oscillospiraceae bacterium]